MTTNEKINENIKELEKLTEAVRAKDETTPNKRISLEQWKLALRIMRGELDDQLDKIIASYQAEAADDE